MRSTISGRTLQGDIVGYGALCWPGSEHVGGDAGILQPVYLVQVAEGSSALGAACIVLRADRVEEIREEPT
jgi:hypothetical protein